MFKQDPCARSLVLSLTSAENPALADDTDVSPSDIVSTSDSVAPDPPESSPEGNKRAGAPTPVRPTLSRAASWTKELVVRMQVIAQRCQGVRLVSKVQLGHRTTMVVSIQNHQNHSGTHHSSERDR